MSGFLLDANLVSELVKPKRNQGVLAWINGIDPTSVFVSALTLGEIRKGINLGPPDRRAALEAWLEVELRSKFKGRILAVDESIAERWGALTASARLRGEVIGAVDGLLAATALDWDLIVATRNVRHFRSAGAQTLNPWT